MISSANRPQLQVAMTVLLLTWLVACRTSPPPHQPVTVDYHIGSVMRLATLEEGQELIGKADEWVRSFGAYDYKVRLDSNDATGEAEFLEFARSQVLAWKEHEVEALRTVAARLLNNLTALGLNLDVPNEVMLVKTTGREEGGMGGYTRGTFIVIPEPTLNSELDRLEAFLLHELFHVMTRHDPAIRKPLYALVGFDHAGPLDYPGELTPRRITNPDAFHYDSYIEIEIDGSPVKLTPLTLSASESYAGGGIARNVGVEFLRVEVRDGRMVPVREDGRPVLMSIREMPSEYWRKIGRNTNYIIHPEEIMADNFSLAIRQQRNVQNPEILDALLEVLSE